MKIAFFKDAFLLHAQSRRAQRIERIFHCVSVVLAVHLWLSKSTIKLDTTCRLFCYYFLRRLPGVFNRRVVDGP